MAAFPVSSADTKTAQGEKVRCVRGPREKKRRLDDNAEAWHTDAVFYGGCWMRVYLDNSCYNLPFDDQMQLKVRLETEAKLFVRGLMRAGIVEYVWSDMLCREALDNPFPVRRAKIVEWMSGTRGHVEIRQEIVMDAAALMSNGFDHADAFADCKLDYETLTWHDGELDVASEFVCENSKVVKNGVNKKGTTR